MMSKNKEIREGNYIRETGGSAKDPALEKSIQSLLNGSFLTREKALKLLPYLFFLAFIGILYIANIYYAEKKIREINGLRKELKELRYEYITEKSKLMYRSKQSEVAKSLEGTGIEELRTPPTKIIIPANESNIHE
jgi:hypothetical protein